MIYLILGLTIFIIAVVGYIIRTYSFMADYNHDYALSFMSIERASTHIHRTNVQLQRYESKVRLFIPIYDQKVLNQIIETEVRKLARQMIENKTVNIEIRSNDGSGDHHHVVDFSLPPYMKELRVTALLVPNNTHTKNLYVESAIY